MEVAHGTGVPPDAPTVSFVRALASEMYVLIVAGISTGVIVAGLGSRLAMLLLRFTSSDTVDGIASDDGFTIGRFTLAGTYNLLLIGAGVGVLGAAAYQWVRPWLIGPRWFRYATLALAAGAVVGSMLVHADGIDFVLLDPMWLAVSLFVALPAVFAVCIAFAVDRVDRHLDQHPAGGRRRWVVPVLLVVAFPPVVVVLMIAVAVLVPWVLVRDEPPVRSLVGRPVAANAVRVAWLAIAVLGLMALVGDIADLRAMSS